MGKPFLANEPLDAGAVTSLVHRIFPAEREAEAAMKMFLAVLPSFRGYLGSEVFPPIPGFQEGYVSLYRFESGETLRIWLESTERRQWAAALDAMAVGQPISLYFGQGLLILAAIFPCIAILRRLLKPLYDALPLPLAFLITLSVDVTVLTYVIMPRFTRAMGFWLRPSQSKSIGSELMGILILAGIVASTLALVLRFGF